MRVCIVGASGKLGQYMVQHALATGHFVLAELPGEAHGPVHPLKSAH